MTETIEEVKEERAPVKYRSVSQAKQMLPELGGCAHQYYLQRRVRAWQKPAAWLSQGTALHAVVEAVERSGRTMTLEEAQALFSVEYSAAIEELSAETPNLSYWFPSGPYNGWMDVPRRHNLGLEQVERYFRFIEKNPEWVPDTYDDTLAVELEFNVKFGDVEVKGFIDQVDLGKPVDVKSGNKPGDDFQLGTYAGALEQEYGVPRTVGYYWMGRSGKLTAEYDLTDWTQDRLADVYGRVDALVLAEEFDPTPEASKCNFCPVKNACDYSAATY